MYNIGMFAGDLINLVKRIQHLVSYKHNQYNSNEMFYETQAMAVIIVAIKLLFSLDDCTEYHLSDTATQLNKYVHLLKDYFKSLSNRP